MSAPNLVDRIFVNSGNGIALRDAANGTLTYADLKRLILAESDRLRRVGFNPGDRVAVRMQKSVDALIFYLACLKSGLVYMPLNPSSTRSELDYFIADAEPAALVVDDLDHEASTVLAELDVPVMGLRGNGDAPVTRMPCPVPDAAALLYTSGTTGRPKGALIGHSNLMANADALMSIWGLTSSDVVLHALPIFHAHGLFLGCHLPLLAGAAVLLLPKFEVEAVVSRLPDASIFMGVPTLYSRLLQSARFDREACRNLRLMICGSAPLSAELFERVHERTGQHIVERFGTTETSICASNPVVGERRPGTVGRAIPSVDVKLLDAEERSVRSGDVGRVAIKGPSVFAGYWKRSSGEGFTANGYFLTGDLGRFSEDGYLSLVGREKDLIISGGLNVYPAEVEAAIGAELDGECAVIGVPHLDLGEAVLAVVSKESGAPNPKAVIDAVRSRLASYKVPKAVVLIDVMPRNVMGKILKAELRSRFAAHFTEMSRRHEMS